MLRLFAPRRQWRLHICATTPDQRPYLDALTTRLSRQGHIILAAPDAPLGERIAAARACEVCLLLLGPEYATRESHASFSATELETFAALEGGESKLLIFGLPGVERAAAVEQQEFIARVRDFTAGTFQATVASPDGLLSEVAAALARLEEAAQAVSRDLTRAVMISSTGDLTPERTRLREMLIRMRRPVIDYQTAASETATPIERVVGWAEKCRALLLILGRRYGYVSPVDGLGATELEFVTALGAGRPILALIRPDALTTEDTDQRLFVERVRHFLPQERVRLCPTLDDMEREARTWLRALPAAEKPSFRSSQKSIRSPAREPSAGASPVPEERTRVWYTRQIQRWLGTLPHARNPGGMPLVELPLVVVEQPMDLQEVFNETQNHLVHFASESMAYIGAATPEDALAHTPRMLIAGPPGSGKSVILRWLALRCLAADSTSAAGDRLPALVALPAYARARRAGQVASLLDYVEREERRMLLIAPSDPARLREALTSGHGLLLLDDWSALDATDQEVIAADIAACAETLPRATPVVIAQRASPPTPVRPAMPLADFTPRYVLPLMQVMQNEIIRQWLEAARAAEGLDEERAKARFEEITFQMRSLDSVTRWARTPQLLITLITVLDSLQERSLGMLGGGGVALLRRALRLILTLEQRPHGLWEKERLLMALARQTLDAEPHMTLPNDNPQAHPHETFPDELLRAAWRQAAPTGGDLTLEETLRGLSPLLAPGPDGWAYDHPIFSSVYTVAALAEREPAARADWTARRRLYAEKNMTLVLLPGELDRRNHPAEGDAVVETLLASDEAAVAGSAYADPDHIALYVAASAQGARAAPQARGGPGVVIARRLVALGEERPTLLDQICWSLLMLGPAAEAAQDTLIAQLESRSAATYARAALLGLARSGVERAQAAMADYELRHPPRPPRFASIAAQVEAQRARGRSAAATGDARERWLAAYELSAFGPFAAPALPDLILLLASDDEMARGCAAQALAGMGAPAAPALPTLLKMALDDTGHGGIGFTDNANCATFAVKRLAMFVTAEMVREVSERLRSEDTRAVDRALWALWALGPAAAEATPSVIALALQRSKEVSAFLIVQAVRSFGSQAVAEAMTTIADTLQSGDQKTERQALTLVSAFKADAAPLCDLLRARIANPEDPNHIWLFAALGDLGAAATPALPDLRERLDHLRQARQYTQALDPLAQMPRMIFIDHSQARYALDTLAKIGPAARPLLGTVLALLDDPENGIRSAIFDALVGMRVEVTPEIEGAILRGIEDEQAMVRNAAVQAAAKLRPTTQPVAAAMLRVYYASPQETMFKMRLREALDALWDAGGVNEAASIVSVATEQASD